MVQVQQPSRQAQASIYLILAVIVVLIILFLSFSDSRISGYNYEPPDQVQAYVRTCLLQAGIESLLDVADAGGISLQNAGSKEKCESVQLPESVPQTKAVERSVEDNAWKYLEICYRNFSDFAFQGLSVRLQNSSQNSLKVTITDERVALHLHQPLLIEGNNHQSILKDFSAEIEAPIAGVLADAKNIQRPHPDGIDRSKNRFNTTYFSWR